MVCHCDVANRESILDEAIKTVLSSLDMEVVLERTAMLLKTNFGATRMGIFTLVEGEPDVMDVLFVFDRTHPVPVPGTKLPLGGTVVEAALKKRTPQVVEHINPGSPRYAEESELGAYGYGALACFPLVFEDRSLGALEIVHVPKEGLVANCFDAAEKISRLIAIALHNSMMVSEVRRLNRLLSRENTILKDQIRQARQGWRYIAESPLMREVMEKVRLVAPTDTTVLVRGETGTGKEGIARTIHELSRRSGGPFVTVNLGAIPETLIESELFGHEKGAFTGAIRRKNGRFEQASGGTIFLDEVGDAPLAVQIKLLRALQEREIQRVGGDETIKVDVRVVAATNRPLERLLDEGAFRADLYYRLSTFPMFLPPLSERPGDLRPLVRYFVERHSAAMNRKPPDVPEAVFRDLESREWPGNVRELENFIERALLFSPGPVLHLSEAAPPGRKSRDTGARPDPGRPERFDDAVKDMLLRALNAASGRIHGPTGAAAILGLKPTTLQGKLKRYGIGRPQRR
jgi:formate hydrogenlyase transcriptional activator